MIFDTHAHYDDEAFDPDRGALLDSLAAAGIGAGANIIVAGSAVFKGDCAANTRAFLDIFKEYDR